MKVYSKFIGDPFLKCTDSPPKTKSRKLLGNRPFDPIKEREGFGSQASFFRGDLWETSGVLLVHATYLSCLIFLSYSYVQVNMCYSGR